MWRQNQKHSKTSKISQNSQGSSYFNLQKTLSRTVLAWLHPQHHRLTLNLLHVNYLCTHAKLLQWVETQCSYDNGAHSGEDNCIFFGRTWRHRTWSPTPTSAAHHSIPVWMISAQMRKLWRRRRRQSHLHQIFDAKRSFYPFKRDCLLFFWFHEI